MSKQALAYKNKGNDEFKKGNFAKAIEFYTYATEMDPGNHIFYTNRAACYERMGKFDKALRDSKKSLKKKPDWIKGHMRSGNAHMKMTPPNPEEAMKCYEMCVQLDPKQPTYERLLNEAKKLFYKDKSLADMEKMKGNEFFKSGKIEDALKSYTRALNMCGTDAKEQKVKAAIYANRAMCYQQLYNPDMVIKDATAALAIDPAHTKCLIRRAQAYESLEKWKKSLADFEAANRLAPTMQVAYQGASRLRQAIRQSGGM